jgi:quinoprotein glucose dehydrogenase
MSAEMRSVRSADVNATKPGGGIAHAPGFTDRRDMRVGRLVGGITIAFGAILAAGGLWLLTLGSSSYLAFAGAGYLVAGALLWRHRATGALLMLALLSATIGRGLCEVGADSWAQFPFVLLPAAVAILALAGARRFSANDWRSMMAFSAILLTIAIALFVRMAFEQHSAFSLPPNRDSHRLSTVR